MELTSLLFGDFADLFQDSRISDVEASAKNAAAAAGYSRTESARLAKVVEQRIRELERDNAVLSVLLVRILKHLSKSQPDETQKIMDDVAAVVRSGTPASSNVLMELLNLPTPPRTPINNYTKPVAIGPRPPQSPAPMPKKPKP